ncbi:MAG: glycosyltransferase [Bacteroidota bacterium]
MKKVAIICNSNNAFFQNYYGALLDNIDDDRTWFYGNKIFAENAKRTKFSISSFTNSAFFDFFSIVDFCIAPVVFFGILWKRIKIIHFVSAHPSNITLAIMAKMFGIKTLFTIHDLIPHPDRKSRIIAYYNKLVVDFLATDIVLHNKDYVEQLDKKSTHYIPLSGYKEDFIKRKFSKKLLFFGRIEPYKGLNNLLMLAKILREKKMDWEVVIAGKGKIPEVNHSEIPNVKIINDFISNSELRELHKESAFTILPYDSASQSAVIIHSYAFATPVIVYDVGALADYVEDNKTGLVVNHNDFNTIIHFLKKMDEQTFNSFQENVSHYFMNNYSDLVFAKDSLALYSKW